MKTTTFRKLLAVLLGAAMLLGVLAGCGSKDPQQTDPANPQISDTVPVGMVVLSTEAAVKISYDADGMVLDISGMNDHGIVLADTYTDYLGKSCATVVKELVLTASAAGNLSDAVKNIVIKQAVGSALPGSHFLESLATEAETAVTEAGSSATVTLIDETGLDEDGYINLDTVKALLLHELGGETYDEFYGDSTPRDDRYIFTVVVNGIESSHAVDAVTGLIAEATDEDLLGDPDYYEETEYIEYEPEPDYFEEDLYEDPYQDGDIEIPIGDTTEIQD